MGEHDTWWNFLGYLPGWDSFVANMKHYLFFADTSGDFAAVSLAARMPDGALGVNRYPDAVRRISFYTQPGKDGMAELIMRHVPILLNTNDDTAVATITLARDVTQFQLEFYDLQKAEWLDEWKYTNKLPVVVKIVLGLGKDKNGKPYDVATSLVALPSVGVAGDIQTPFAPPPGQAPPPPP